MAKILIIDDDPLFSDMTRQRLERSGHQVIVHVGPFGATAAANDPELDLIILDVFMPGLQGPDLLDIMRRQQVGAAAAVVFCSSMDPEPLAELAEKRGADGSISKSVDRYQLLDKVGQVLERGGKS